eukprot:5388579-Prymnesium_polylepis.1
MADAMRAMIDWDGERSSWLQSALLKPRCLGAYIDTELVACVQIRYKHDLVSGLRAFLSGKHVMVVDHVLVVPTMPSRSRMLVSAGVADALCELARLHDMHVVLHLDI